MRNLAEYFKNRKRLLIVINVIAIVIFATIITCVNVYGSNTHTSPWNYSIIFFYIVPFLVCMFLFTMILSIITQTKISLKIDSSFSAFSIFLVGFLFSFKTPYEPLIKEKNVEIAENVSLP
jgi:uncharacterized membrane protein